MPRSGSTLIEQILASHSLVEGTHELSDIQRIVVEIRGLEDNRYPAVLAELAPEDIVALCIYRGGPQANLETYVRGNRIYQAPGLASATAGVRR